MERVDRWPEAVELTPAGTLLALAEQAFFTPLRRQDGSAEARP